MQSGRKDTLEERYAIAFCFKLGKMPQKRMECVRLLLTILHESSISFEWHKRFKEGRESVMNDKLCRRSKEVNTTELIGQRVRVRVTMLRFKGVQVRFRRKRSALFKSGQWHFDQDNAPVLNSILVTDYLTKVGINTVPHHPIVETLLPVTFSYSLSSETVIMRQLRR